MEPFYPLASDADADPSEVAEAQAACAFALGRLAGLLAGLTDTEIKLFCVGLLRTVLLSALVQAGFADADQRFNTWFAGLDRGPQETPLTACSAYAVVRALLGEFSHHPWEPLADAAQTIALAARFGADRPMQAEDALAEKAIGRSISLVKQAGAEGEPPLPFASLARLNALLRAEPLFAPLERTVQIRSLGDRAVALEQAAPRTPLWAVDAALGRLLTACGAWQIALPCPGALTAETLQPQIWPGERALVAARTLRASATRLAELVGKARRRAALMREQLGHLRSSARAPQVWILLAGFAPLGLDQMASACGVSRRGTYAIGDALVAAGLARRETVKGKVQLVAKEARSRPLSEPGDEASALPHSALAEFDAAMAEIDRLLANSSDQV